MYNSKFLSHKKALQFMRDALNFANEHSKDPSTKVAAIILGANSLETRSQGYNGMPRRCNDDVPERQERPEKYFWFEHAERNAIYNAARVGTPLEGSILIATLSPCMDCARAIAGVGIQSVIALGPPSLELANRWNGHLDKAKELFNEVGIEHVILDPWDVIEGADPIKRAYFAKLMGLDLG